MTAPTGLTRDASEANGVKINFTDTSDTELRYDLQRKRRSETGKLQAATLVNKDVPPGVFAGGNPMKIIYTAEEMAERQEKS